MANDDGYDYPRIARALILGDRETVGRMTREGLDLGLDPKQIIFKGLIPGMDVVGDKAAIDIVPSAAPAAAKTPTNPAAAVTPRSLARKLVIVAPPERAPAVAARCEHVAQAETKIEIRPRRALIARRRAVVEIRLFDVLP